MRKQRDWFWQIKETGQGPDYFLSATFGPSNAERLVAIVPQHLPAGFVPDEEFFVAQNRAKYRIYDCYIDQHSYNRLVALQEKGDELFLSYYGTIEVRDHELLISHYCGFYYDEGELVMAIAESSDLTLQEWKVTYGGNLYAWGEVAGGTSAEELLDYLHWKELPDAKPDFKQIRIELEKVLAQPEISEQFELREFLVGDWLCQALMLWKIPPYLGGSDLSKAVVEPVSQKCQVPGSGRRGGSPISPDYPIATYGEYIQFGYAHWSGYDHKDEFQEYRYQVWRDYEKKWRKR